MYLTYLYVFLCASVADYTIDDSPAVDGVEKSSAFLEPFLEQLGSILVRSGVKILTF